MDDERRKGRFSTRGRATPDPVKFWINEEEFTGRRMVVGSAILDYAAGLMAPDEVTQASAAKQFFRSVLTHDCTHEGGEAEDCSICLGTGSDTREFQRFKAYIDDPANEVHLTDLGEISAFLIGRYGERPTKAPSAPAASTSSKDGSGSGSGDRG